MNWQAGFLFFWGRVRRLDRGGWISVVALIAIAGVRMRRLLAINGFYRKRQEYKLDSLGKREAYYMNSRLRAAGRLQEASCTLDLCGWRRSALR